MVIKINTQGFVSKVIYQKENISTVRVTNSTVLENTEVIRLK